jgi:hypothetical protein
MGALVAAAGLCVAVWGAGAAEGGESRMVEARMAFVHEGAGSFYPRHDVVRKNAVIEVGELDASGRWVRVLSYPVSEAVKAKAEAAGAEAGAKEKEGELWIAERVLSRGEKELPSPKIELAQEAFRLDELTASSALRGFGPYTQDLLNTRQITPAELAYVLVRPFTTDQYLGFHEATLAGRKLPEMSVSWAPFEQFDTEVRQDMGDVIAIRILKRYGLKPVDDVGLSRYVNMLATWLVTHSPSYWLQVRVLVVEGKEVTSFSAPGGVIIVTDKLVVSCKDEAELASVLAHEIVHIARRHGLKERAEKKKATGIDLDGLEAELTAEWVKRHKGQKPPWDRPTIQELDAMATEFLERTLLRGYRLYEESEADAYGVVFLYFAGYDTKAMTEFINRVLARRTTAWPVGMEMHPMTMDRTVFIEEIDATYLSPIRKAHPKARCDARMAERFEKETKALRAKVAGGQ